MTLAKIAEGAKAGFLKAGADLDDMTVRAEKANPPRKGNYGFTTLVTISDGSGQDAKCFTDGEHTPALGEMFFLTGVRFYDYSEPAKEKGPGVWRNLGLTAKGMAPAGSSPAAQSQPGSPAGAASSTGRESEGERRDSIEAQAVMKASAVIIRGAYDGVLSKGGDMTGFKIMHDFDSVFDHLWTKLQTTKGKAQPAQPAQPAKPGGEGEGTFIEAQQVRAILMKMYNDDAVKAKAAFQAITGVDGLSACPDKACAEKWLTQARKIEASRNGLKRDDSKAAFLDTLIKPGLDMDERNSELENVVASDKLDDIPF